MTVPSMRYPSSRAESFKTAREFFSSSDDEGGYRSSPQPPLSIKKSSPLSSSGNENPSLLPPLHVGKTRSAASSKPQARDMGLGLGLDSDGSMTPTAISPKVVETPESLSSPWVQELNVVVDDPLHVTEPVAVQEINASKRPRLRDDNISGDSPRVVSTPEDFQASLERSLSLRNQIGEIQYSPASESIERFAEQIQWPGGFGDRTPDSELQQVDSRRISQMSATSTVIEAVVVTTPTQRRQRLRHSSKNTSLRTASSPLSGSNRSSLVSNETRPKLHHKRNKLSEGNRMSLNSDSGISMGSDRYKHQMESIPSSDIPQRKSSLKSTSKTRKQSQGRSNPKHPATSSRPTTAPTGQKGQLDQPRRKARAMSDSAPAANLSDLRRGRTRELAPVIPTRTSSLSAPTSRNASRTTSLTSTSLHKHTTQQDKEYRQQPVRVSSHETTKELVITIDRVESGHSEESAGQIRRSMLTTTPFSLAPSMQSLTPGPYEVNEATAISIYPHNNNSLLVVQQTPRRDSQKPQISARLTENVRISLKDRPFHAHNFRTHVPVDSPLRHHLELHNPPAVMLIPPTPATDIVQASRGRDTNVAPTGPLSKIRRALSAKRYPDTVVAPIARSLSRRNSTGGHGRMIRTAQPSNKLSPFWRPRGFWDDLSDDEKELEVEREDAYVRNTLGLNQKRVITGPASLARRLGSLKRKKQRPGTSDGISSKVVSAVDDDLRDTERRVGILARMPHTSQLSSSFVKFQDTIEKMRAKRTEERLERQRARLKRNIGPVILQSDARTFY